MIEPERIDEQKSAIPATTSTPTKQSAILRQTDVDRTFGLLLFIAVGAILLCAWAMGGFHGRPDTDAVPGGASSPGAPVVK